MTWARRPWFAAAVLAAALAGCSSNEPAASQSAGTSGSTTATDLATTPSEAATTSPASATGSPSGTAPVTPVALPTTFVPVDKVIKDPDLGHEIKVTRMARDLPWPDPTSDEAQAFELVGVEMTWTPGVTYTAALRTVDFSIGSSAQYPNRPDAVINPGLQAAGWTILPAELPNGQTATGWLVFKVDPKDAASLRLDYTRPASRVTDSGQTFPKTVFSAQLVG
ncbi:MAG: hypothetical protein ACOYBY_17095 [Dermatophilaceae bacterium]